MLELGAVRGLIELDDRFSARLQAAGTGLDRFEQKFEAMGMKLQSAAAKLAPMSLLLAAVGIASFKMANEFELAMTKVSTIAGESVANLGRMRKAVLDLSPAVGIGPKALADALLVVESTGIHGALALDILERSAKASATGLGEAKDIARAVTAAITAYGSENLSAAEATDILFAAVKAGGAEANEFAGTLGRVIGISAQIGVSFQELTTFMATFTRLGVDADEAATALRGTLTTILHPTKETREQMAALGISIDQLRKNIKEKGLTESMIELVNATNGNLDALGAIIPNTRALAGVLGAAGRQADEMRKVLDQTSQSAGILERAFKQTAETGSFKWASFMATVEKLAISFGDRLAPAALRVLAAFTPVVEMAIRLLSAFGELPQPIQTITLGLLALGAAASPVLFMLSNLVRLAGVASAAVAALATTFGASTAAAATNAVALTANAAATIAVKNAVKFAEHEQMAFNFGIEQGRNALGQFTPRIWQAEQQLLPLSGVMTKTATATSAAAAETSIFARVLAAVASPTGLAIAAIGLLAIGARALTGSWDFLVKPLRDSFNTFKSLGSIVKSTAEIIGSITFIGFKREITGLKEMWSDFVKWRDAQTKNEQGFKKSFEEMTYVERLKEAARLWFNTGDMWETVADHFESAAMSAKAMAGFMPALPTVNPTSAFQRPDVKTFDREMLDSFKRSMDLSLSGAPSPDKELNDMKADLEKQEAKILLTARAFAAKLGSADLMSLPVKVQEDYYDALQAVIEQYGSLKKLGPGVWEETHKSLDLSVGSAKKLGVEFLKMHDERFYDAFQQERDRSIENTQAIAKAYLDTRVKIRDAETDRARQSMNTFEFQRMMITRWRDEQIKALDFSVGAHQEYADEIARQADEMFKNISVLEKTKTDPTGMLEMFRRNFKSIKLEAPGAFAGIGKDIVHALSSSFHEIPELLIQAFTGGGGLLGAAKALGVRIGQSIAEPLYKALKPNAQRSVSFGSGLGAAVGGAVGGGGGSAVGAMAGNIGGALAGQIGIGVAPGVTASLGTLAAEGSIAAMAGLAAATAGIGIAAVAAYVAIKKLTDRPVRDAIRGLEDSFGGPDGLRRKVQEFGEYGQRLAENLYRLGSNATTAQIQKALKDFTDGVKKADDALSRWGVSLDSFKKPADRARDSVKQLAEDLDLFMSMLSSDPIDEEFERVAVAMEGPLTEAINSWTKFGIEIPSMLDPFFASLAKATDLSEGLDEALNAALRRALLTGEKLPAGFEPLIRTLIKSGDLAEDLAYLLLGIEPPKVIPWKEMQAAAEEFDISLESLGDGFKQGRLNEGAEDLAKKWKVLVENGADIGAVMVGMKEKANEFLGNALKWGLEIPASMRPMLEAMLKAGLLTDDAGVKLENLDDVKWGRDLTQAIDDLIAKLDALISKIFNIPDPHITPVIDPPSGWQPSWGTPNPDGNPNPNNPSGGDPSRINPDGTIGAATGYEGWVFNRTRMTVAENGPEYVKVEPMSSFSFDDFSAATAGAGGADGASVSGGVSDRAVLRAIQTLPHHTAVAVRDSLSKLRRF